jgi:ribosomal-protein-serine acetyltransferase
MKDKYLIPSQIVVSPTVTLRVLKDEDAATHFDLVDKNREGLSRWLFWVEESKSAADSLKFIRDSKQEIKDNESFPYGIWEDGQLVGTAGCVAWDRQTKTLELGAWLDQDHEGRGIVTDALRAVIEVTFSGTDTETIQVFCEPANTKSDNIPKRLGFKFVGQVEREHGNETRIFNVYELKRP